MSVYNMLCMFFRYRGKILKIKSPEEISVFMIDFGSDHDLSPHVLFREVLYTDIGSFATKVKLEKVNNRPLSLLNISLTPPYFASLL